MLGILSDIAIRQSTRYHLHPVTSGGILEGDGDNQFPVH